MLLLGCYSAGFITNLTLSEPALPFTDFEGLLKDGSYRLGMARVNEQVEYFKVSILMHLLSVYGLTPGSCSTGHIYKKQYTEQHNGKEYQDGTYTSRRIH